MCFKSMGVREAHQLKMWHFNNRHTVALNLNQFYVIEGTVFSTFETPTCPDTRHYETDMPTGTHNCATPIVITQGKWWART